MIWHTFVMDVKFILQENQRQRQIKEKEHKARPNRLDLDQIVSTQCNPEQDQDKGSPEKDFYRTKCDPLGIRQFALDQKAGEQNRPVYVRPST